MGTNLPRSALVTLFIGALLLFGYVSPAAAIAPTRETLPFEGITLTGGLSTCEFDVLIEPLTNKEVLTTFYDKHGDATMYLVTGTFKIRLTNLDTGETLDVNASGPGRLLSEEGSLTQITQGPFVLFFPEVLFPNNPQLLLVKGRTTTEFNSAGEPTNFRVEGGQVTDLCAALS